MDGKGVVYVPRLRTRKQAADFYRDLHASLKGKKRVREGSVVVNNEVDFGCEISDGKRFNGGEERFKKRGAKANRRVDVKSADSVLLSDDDDAVECLGEEVVSNGSSFIVISESESGSCSKIDDSSKFHPPERAVSDEVASPSSADSDAPVLLEISSTSDESSDEDFEKKEDMPSRNRDAKSKKPFKDDAISKTVNLKPESGKRRFSSKNPSYDSKRSFMADDRRKSCERKEKMKKESVHDLDSVDMNTKKCKYSWKADEPTIIINEETSTKGRKKTRKKDSGNLQDFAKILMDAMYSSKTGLRCGAMEADEASPPDDHHHDEHVLPLKFRFEDEVESPPEKTEWEEHMDSLFCEMEFALRLDDPRVESTSFSENEDEDGSVLSGDVEEAPELRCSRGDHDLFLDEQIGISCRHCAKIVLDIKYVLPSFHKPRPNRRDRRADSETSEELHIHDGLSPTEPPATRGRARGTVWDLLDGVERELYPHQREGIEFIWKNIGGGIALDKLRQPNSDNVRGCIISHAPGTGKTRLSIVFLQSFLRLYPTRRPVIVAPRGMLLTWESEFKKWKVDIPFHNLNRRDLTGDENLVASKRPKRAGRDWTKLVKLVAWIRGGSVLGISYTLFANHVGTNKNDDIRRLLLEFPDVLVLDEGHTPRNDLSNVWKALMEVSTRRRVILSGTPFQNNLRELYTTLRLVNPGFESRIKAEERAKKFRDDDEGLKKLKPMIQQFVHVHKGTTTLDESLPGLRCAIVFLKPTELQKGMLEAAAQINRIFNRIRYVSMISVHPSLMLRTNHFRSISADLECLEADSDAGVKTRFLIELIALADALGERVLVFSQYIDPLAFVKKQIESRFSWREGREIVYMDGNYDEKSRQEAMSWFNDEGSEARVMLASERACSEGINLAGASRVVLLDTVWNPSVEKQAISRAYRLGQKRMVYVYRLFTSGTEVEQFRHQVRKKRMSNVIFSTHHDVNPDGRSRAAAAPGRMMWQDEVLDAMREVERLGDIFERVVHQGKEDDFVDHLGLDYGF